MELAERTVGIAGTVGTIPNPFSCGSRATACTGIVCVRGEGTEISTGGCEPAEIAARLSVDRITAMAGLMGATTVGLRPGRSFLPAVSGTELLVAERPTRTGIEPSVGRLETCGTAR